MKCAVSLNDLKPGDYEFDIILRDELGSGQPVTQSFPFKVVLAKEPVPGP